MSKITSNFGTPVKVTVTERIEKEVEVVEIDWNQVPQGTIFTATINGEDINGRIFNDEGSIFLCNNKRSGATTYTTLGYDSSFNVRDGSAENLSYHDVSAFELHDVAPEGAEVLDMIEIPEAPLKAAGYEVKFHADHISLGCQEVTHERINAIVAKMNSGFISPVEENDAEPEMEVATEEVSEDTAG